MINYIEKGTGLFEFLASAGYQLYQLDGIWTVEPAGSDEIVNALILAYQQPVAPRTITNKELIDRFPVNFLARAINAAENDHQISVFLRIVFDWPEIDLDSEYFVYQLNYIKTVKDYHGWLLLPADIDVILA